MATISRTGSSESATSATRASNGGLNAGETTPSPTLSEDRLSSHSLLSVASSGGRKQKSRLNDAATTNGSMERTSLSMPPPATKPSSQRNSGHLRQHSKSIAGKAAGMEEATVGQDPSPHMEALQKTTSWAGSHASAPEISTSEISEGNLKPPTANLARPGDRLSLSSMYSLGSAVLSGVTGVASAPQSTASSNAGSIKSDVFEQPMPPLTAPIPLSPSMGAATGEAVAPPTTATDPVLVTANAETVHQISPQSSKDPTPSRPSGAARHLDSWNTAPPSRPSAPRRSRSKHIGPGATSTAASSAVSPSDSDRISTPIGKIGVCALDVKARSKACRNILTRLSSNGEFDVIIFGDKAILDEAVENWPKCDYMISFFSEGFPLDKAIAYKNLRRPFVVNDLPMQKIIWDRRLCLRILDSVGVPTPQRIEVNRDGGPTLESAKLAEHLHSFSKVKLEGPEDGTGGGTPKPTRVTLAEDGDVIIVDGKSLRKPFVEKPTSGEDHNIHIYFPKDQNGGGGRRLFRKIGNKSSEWDDNMKIPRAVTEPDSSYVYEQFLDVDNAEDIKAYTVGPDFCHAETRTSPVVDGLVRRNTHGKEIRYICKLRPEEQLMASKIVNGFGQRVCGFDMLRVKNQSFVIDVNGWSFVKDNNDYYDKSAKILRDMFITEKQKRDGTYVAPVVDQSAEKVVNEKTEPEKSQSHRKTTIAGHRSELVKKLMKSPSMSRMRGHQSGTHAHGATSPELSLARTPLSSPPTLENENKMIIKDVVQPNRDQLPPPAIQTGSTINNAQATPLEEQAPAIAPEPALKHSWKLKGMVAVVRHADRTPKQKLKFTFHTQPFVDLLKGHQEEVLLKGEAALNSVIEAAKTALKEGVEDADKLRLLQTSLARKGAWTGTKVQIKPMFRKRKPEEIKKIKSEIEQSIDPEGLKATESFRDGGEQKQKTNTLSRPPTRSDSISDSTLSRFSAAENDLVLDKLQLIVKWGGEPTHSARYQSQDLGENMRGDMMLMNKEALENVRVFSSSERRVTTSAQIWAASFLNQKEVGDSRIKIRKDLLDDSNAAKDVMDKVKKELKLLLREGHKAPPQFAWPANMPEPSVVVRQVAELMTFHREVMRENFKRLDGSASASLNALNKSTEEGQSADPKSTAQAQTLASIQSRWCCGENPELFKERWEKLFTEFCESEKVDPSKISELYDTMKFDALHNRQFLEWVFTPPPSMVESQGDGKPATTPNADQKPPHRSRGTISHHHHERKNSGGEAALEKSADIKPPNANLAQRMGLRRKSVLNQNPPSPQAPLENPDTQESYFKLFSGTGQTRLKQDARLEKLRELYKLAKVLFDFVCPQEYGISNDEKLEIGLLTSLPLLKEIVHDLEEVQASEDAKSFVYFTKESHIYTLLNCILEGGIKTKIERNAIPELDYLSNITFELYEAEDQDADLFSYSIRIAITPGCHTFDPLDTQLDSKHSIGCAPRRSLTAHTPWNHVIETLRARFHTVKLPKSFLTVNVSEGHGSEGDSDGGKGGGEGGGVGAGVIGEEEGKGMSGEGGGEDGSRRGSERSGEGE